VTERGSASLRHVGPLIVRSERGYLILRVTNKAAKRLKLTPEKASPKSADQVGDWTVHVFTTQRKQFFFFTNSHSLLSVVVSGRRVKSLPGLLAAARQSLESYFCYCGVANANPHIFPSSGFPVSVCKVGDQSLLGSMNEMIYHTKFHMMDGLENLDEIAKRINDMPMFSLPGVIPHQVHLSNELTIIE